MTLIALKSISTASEKWMMIWLVPACAVDDAAGLESKIIGCAKAVGMTREKTNNKEMRIFFNLIPVGHFANLNSLPV
jgi:hypothetical protein